MRLLFFPTTITVPLPCLRAINVADPADKARHDCMVTLVTQMLESTSDRMVRNGFRENVSEFF